MASSYALSLSDSDWNGSSLSTFMAAATQRSAILVTAFSLAKSNRWAKLRSLVSLADAGRPALLPLRLPVELAMLFFLAPYATELFNLLLNDGLYPYAEPSARLVLENVLTLFPASEEDNVGGDGGSGIIAFDASGTRFEK
jgi:hypothetical protein